MVKIGRIIFTIKINYMTLLNHVGVLILWSMLMVVFYFWNMLGNIVLMSEIYSKNYMPYLRATLFGYIGFEAFYWTLKIFF